MSALLSPRILRDALAVAACRAPVRLAWTDRPERLRTWAWAALLEARARCGSLAAAIEMAEAEEAAWRRKKEGVA